MWYVNLFVCVCYDRWRSLGGCRTVSLMCGRCWGNQRKADTPGTHPSMITMKSLILYACDLIEFLSEQPQTVPSYGQKAWPWLVWRSWSVTISSVITGAFFVLSYLGHQKSRVSLTNILFHGLHKITYIQIGHKFMICFNKSLLINELWTSV